MASGPVVTASELPTALAPQPAPVASPDPAPPPAATDSKKRRRSDNAIAPMTRTKSSAAPPAAKMVSTPPSEQMIPPLTGAAALADAQQKRKDREDAPTSPNPVRKAIDGLFAPQAGTSAASDAPAPTSLSEGLAAVRSAIKIAPMTPAAESNVRGSPGNNSSADTITDPLPENVTSITNGVQASSPGRMDEDPREDLGEAPSKGRQEAREEPRSNKALTYPGIAMSQTPQRTTSLQSGYGTDDTRSSKRHKCPHCSTDFTRHHNLKSHLLTHSHEKPYSCETCDSRFRRLHDLKRHTKLHTGERPHVCPKCDRSFARGDALARHTKGQGGCAGRRSSMGSFGGDGGNDSRGEGDSMTGVMYTGEASHEPDNMDDDDTVSPSLPSIRKHEVLGDPQSRNSTEYSPYAPRPPSTYPPVSGRPNAGGLYPPASTSPRSGGSSLNSAPPPLGQYAPTISTAHNGVANMYSQGMTESPKPLSPGAAAGRQLGHSASGDARHRSPSLTEQLHHVQVGGRRNTSGHNSPPPMGMSLPPPPPTANHALAPHLPPLQGLGPPDSRFTLHSQANSGHLSGPVNGPPASSIGPVSPSFPPGNASSANNSLSSHSTGAQTSIDRSQNPYGQPTDRLWAYVQGLEAKVNRLEEEVAVLRREHPGHQHR